MKTFPLRHLAACVASLVMDILNVKAPLALPATSSLLSGQAGNAGESRQAILLDTIKLDGVSIVPLDDVNSTVVPTGMVLPFKS